VGVFVAVAMRVEVLLEDGRYLLKGRRLSIRCRLGAGRLRAGSEHIGT
jgi:hypothetical protein